MPGSQGLGWGWVTLEGSTVPSYLPTALMSEEQLASACRNVRNLWFGSSNVPVKDPDFRCEHERVMSDEGSGMTMASVASIARVRYR
jgi:hypothetical protein